MLIYLYLKYQHLYRSDTCYRGDSDEHNRVKIVWRQSNLLFNNTEKDETVLLLWKGKRLLSNAELYMHTFKIHTIHR